MRLAALYDIHGNLPALEAVLEEIGQLNIDQIIIGGDVIPGPMSRECLELLQQIQIPTHFIVGNCEIFVLDYLDHKPLTQLPESVLEDIHWTAHQLTSEQQKFLTTWSQTFSLQMNRLGEVLFCHATPRSNAENFTRLTPEANLLPIFEKLDANIVVCGHTHMQFDREIGKTRVVNAGSVGMPFGKPGAYWLLLDDDIEFRYTFYDLNKAANRIQQTAYPSAKKFAQQNVLTPPSEEAMLKMLTVKHPHEKS